MTLTDLAWIDPTKNAVLPWLDPPARVLFDRPLAVKKDLRREFVCAAVPAPDELDSVFTGIHWGRSVLSTAKYRVLPDGTKQYAVRQYVYRESLPADTQQHAYVFHSPRENYGSDIYSHQEASVSRIEAHEGGDELVPGDPRGLVTGTLTHTDAVWTRQPPVEVPE